MPASPVSLFCFGAGSSRGSNPRHLHFFFVSSMVPLSLSNASCLVSLAGVFVTNFPRADFLTFLNPTYRTAFAVLAQGSRAVKLDAPSSSTHAGKW